jgi:enoyl-CoA hydratase
MTDRQGVLIDTVGSTLVITLDRPERRNAVDLPMAHAVAEALDRLDGDASLRVGVLAGAGGTFCAGMDLREFARGVRPSLPGRGFAGLTERPPVKPLVAAVEGYAYAGGCEIALACDLVVASRGARFALPEVKRGLVAAAGALLRLPLRVPGQIAAELALTGEPLQAERAHHFGLVNRLVEDGQALDTAVELAAQVARNAPLAVRATKQILREARDWTVAEQFDRQRPISEPVFASHDAIEGARAFAEHRAPQWTGA